MAEAFKYIYTAMTGVPDNYNERGRPLNMAQAFKHSYIVMILSASKSKEIPGLCRLSRYSIVSIVKVG